MELFIMRHADAVDSSPNGDFARTLTDKGRKQAEKMGNWLKAQNESDIAVVTSPYPRAHETARIMAECLGKNVAVLQDERLACGMLPDVGSGIIHEYGKNNGALLMLGHAPDLGVLVSYLLGSKDGGVEMRKGGIASLSIARAGFGGGILRWLVHPKLF